MLCVYSVHSLLVKSEVCQWGWQLVVCDGLPEQTGLARHTHIRTPLCVAVYPAMSCLVGRLAVQLYWDLHSSLTFVDTLLFILSCLLQCQCPFLGLVRILPDKQTPEAFTSPRASHRLTNGHRGDHGAPTSNGSSSFTSCNSASSSCAARSVNSRFELAWMIITWWFRRVEGIRADEIVILIMIQVLPDLS